MNTQAGDSSLATSAHWPLRHSRCPRWRKAKPKVVVVGGGPGGATVAKYVAKDGGIDVTLVEPAGPLHHLLPFQSLSRRLQEVGRDHPSYDKMTKAYGIKQVRLLASAVDRDKKADRGSRAASRCPMTGWLLAPGIDIKFDSVPGYSEEVGQEAAACLAGRAADRSCSSASSTRCPTARPSS